MLRDSFGIIWDPSEGQEQGGWGCKSSRTSSMSEIYIFGLFTVLRVARPKQVKQENTIQSPQNMAIGTVLIGNILGGGGESPTPSLN